MAQHLNNTTGITYSVFSSNSSNTNITNTSNDIPTAPLWEMILIILLIIVVIIANLLVIISFFLEPRLRTSFNYYLLNLAVSDFLVGGWSLTNYAIYTYNNYWPLSYTQCSFWMVIDYSCTNESLWGILIISIDRLWAVTFPISYKQHNSNRKSFTVILASWVISIGTAMPGSIRSRIDYAANNDPMVCDWNSDKLPDWASVFYVIVIGEWFPVAATAVCYVITSIRLWQLSRSRRIGQQEIQPVAAAANGMLQESRRKKRNEKQAFILLTLLVTEIVALWTPWFVYSVPHYLLGYTNDMYFTVSYWLAYTMSGINPFLFNAANDDVRRTLKKLFNWRKCCGGNIGKS